MKKPLNSKDENLKRFLGLWEMASLYTINADVSGTLQKSVFLGCCSQILLRRVQIEFSDVTRPSPEDQESVIVTNDHRILAYKRIFYTILVISPVYSMKMTY